MPFSQEYAITRSYIPFQMNIFYKYNFIDVSLLFEYEIQGNETRIFWGISGHFERKVFVVVFSFFVLFFFLSACC